MKTFIFFISFCCLQLISLGQSVAIQPSILDFRLSPGARETQVIRITNLSNKKVSFEAYLADWLRDSTGAHQYFRPDTLDRSCASWVSLDKNFIEVAPNTTQELMVRLNVPSSAAGPDRMRWAMLFLQSADERDSSAAKNKQVNTQVKELLRVGVHIYQTPPSANVLKGKVIALKELSSEERAYEFHMQNVGDAMLNCKAHLELTSIETGKEFRLDNIEFPVFPGAKRKLKITIPSTVPAGKYSALAVLDIGEDYPLEAIEKNIEIR